MVFRGKYVFFVEGDNQRNCLQCLGQEVEIGMTTGKIWFFGFSEEMTMRDEVTFLTHGEAVKKVLELPYIGGMDEIGWAHDRKNILKNRKIAVIDSVKDCGKKCCLYVCLVEIKETFIRSVLLPDCELMYITAIAVE